MDTRQIESEVAVKAVRSSGPGGQNVNKVSTKIQLVFNATHRVASIKTKPTRLTNFLKRSPAPSPFLKPENRPKFRGLSLRKD
jgi:ribosome-associated protein